jgi:flagellar biosynthesis protein FlhB
MVLFLCVVVVGQNAFQVFSLGKVPIHSMVAFIKRECILVGFSIAIAYLAVAICDYFYQKWLFNRKMRMSKREVKDEIKQVEGDQNIKNKIRAVMKAMLRANAINDISTADILIMDGTQLAVAISYKQMGLSAPFCVGKGATQKALIMLEIAKAHVIPIIENPSLAQKLYKDVDVGTFIKPDYYPEIALAILH